MRAGATVAVRGPRRRASCLPRRCNGDDTGGLVLCDSWGRRSGSGSGPGPSVTSDLDHLRRKRHWYPRHWHLHLRPRWEHASWKILRLRLRGSRVDYDGLRCLCCHRRSRQRWLLARLKRLLSRWHIHDDLSSRLRWLMRRWGCMFNVARLRGMSSIASRGRDLRRCHTRRSLVLMTWMTTTRARRPRTRPRSRTRDIDDSRCRGGAGGWWDNDGSAAARDRVSLLWWWQDSILSRSRRARTRRAAFRHCQRLTRGDEVVIGWRSRSGIWLRLRELRPRTIWVCTRRNDRSLIHSRGRGRDHRVVGGWRSIIREDWGAHMVRLRRHRNETWWQRMSDRRNDDVLRTDSAWRRGDTNAVYSYGYVWLVRRVRCTEPGDTPCCCNKPMIRFNIGTTSSRVCSRRAETL